MASSASCPPSSAAAVGGGAIGEVASAPTVVVAPAADDVADAACSTPPPVSVSEAAVAGTPAAHETEASALVGGAYDGVGVGGIAFGGALAAAASRAVAASASIAAAAAGSSGSSEDLSCKSSSTNGTVNRSGGEGGRGSSSGEQPTPPAAHTVTFSEKLNKWTTYRAHKPHPHYHHQRRRQHQISSDFLSEIDAGRRCNRCNDCPGFVAHGWRTSCVKCKCPRTSHAVGSRNWVFGFERLGLEPVPSSTAASGGGAGYLQSFHTGSPMVLEGYAWSPPGLSTGRAADWMRQLPSEKVPKLNTDGEKYRDLQLVYQLPKQDLSLKYCHHVDTAHHSSFQDFICARNDIALDVGHAVDGVKASSNCPNCNKCRKSISSASSAGLAVIAPRFGISTMWHPACFTCTTCDELLVDLTYCVFDDKIYCERHYAENLKPRCGACDELIFSGQYTKALGKDWHCDHFCCWHCDKVLTGSKYVLTDEHPCCVPCYEQNFTHSCQKCQKKIGLDSKDMSYKDMHWHQDCFVCQRCETSLVEKPFAAKNTYLFCGSCYDSEFASRCDACGDTFRPGMKKMEYKNRKWHDRCFQCAVCKVAVGSKPFIFPNDTDVYCVACFEEKFATKCTKCQKVMTTGGVTFKNEAWHRECFTCANCDTMLAGQKFASKNDKPYCANCFGELFAKRCTACSKPITGTGGTRFISFEGRHWHSQCFTCALCSVSMAGKGFITDGEDIICPDCAKEKLMGTDKE